jgi:hypothetical protein
MPRRFVALNVVLAALSAVLIAYIVRQLVMPAPLPAGGRRAAATTVVPSPAETARPPAGSYSVVAARNLFNPSRSESASGTTTASAAPLVRPNLFGIVVREGASIAYLEDPVTKRVVGYRVGDKVIGGTVQTIKSDSVVIERPDGPLDVRLRDPGKPRAAAMPGSAGVPPVGGQMSPFPPGSFPQGSLPQGSFPQGSLPQAQPGATLPGVIPPAASAQPLPPQLQPQIPQPQPGVTAPGAQGPIVPPGGGRRPLPPNLLRRMPPGTGNAPQQ